MPFSINIFDRNDLNASTIFEVGEKNSLNLVWLGSNNKLEHILGSELSLSIAVPNFQDAYLADFSTQDERQFWVKLINEDNGSVMWQGHLLPDSYDEPYKVGTYFVSFVATCGLGTLKNQYLPNAYYEREFTLIGFLAQILKLTGLELDIYVCPALRNQLAPKWHQDYIDGNKFRDGSKKEDAYDILSKMMESSICRVLQEKGAWYVQGLNKLNAFTLEYDHYDHLGVFKGSVTVERSPLDLTGGKKFLATPRITTNVPLKTITALHELDSSVIDTEVYKAKNDGYVVPNDTVLVNHHWVYNNVGFTPKYRPRDYKTYLEPPGSISNKIKLRKEVPLSQGDKVEWNIECTNYWNGSGSTGQTVEELVLNGYWQKILPYEIFYTDPVTGNETVLYSNWTGPNSNDLRYQLSFGTDRKASLSISMIAPVTAYYNLRLYQPQSQPGAKFTGIVLDRIECVPIAVDDVQQYTDIVDANYTAAEEIELQLHDDLRQLASAIRMAPLSNLGSVYDTLTVSNVETMSNADGEFIKLSFSALKTAIAHSGSLTINGDPLLAIGPIYNYLGSQEMYLQYDAEDLGRTVQDGDTLRIELKEYAKIPSNVSQWQSWCDDFYGISFKRYGQAFVETLRRLFKKPHPVLTGTCIGFVWPSDLVMFNYDGDKVWYVLDCQQHLDRYQSTLVLSQNFYGEAVTENLPPIVDAGPDKKLSISSSQVNLLATASDPDGSIVTVLWELVSGDTSVNIVSPGTLSTLVSGLTGNSYEFRVTVTDDSGLQASDTVRVGRDRQYTLVLTQTVDKEKSTNPTNQDQYTALDTEWYDMRIQPELDDDQIARLTIDGIIVKETPRLIGGAKPTTVLGAGYLPSVFEPGHHQLVLLFRKGDVHTLRMHAEAYNTARYGLFPEYANKVYAKVQADLTAEIVQGAPGTFTNLPIQKTVEARK